MGYLSPTLAVRDMKKTIDFYTKSLGFELGMTFPSPDNPEYADLYKDGMVLMFLPAANLGIGDGEKLGTGVNLYLQIDGEVVREKDQDGFRHKNWLVRCVPNLFPAFTPPVNGCGLKTSEEGHHEYMDALGHRSIMMKTRALPESHSSFMS